MRVYEALTTLQQIQNPVRKSEFEIQASLYSKLKEDGFKVRGCVSLKRHKAQFDLVVFKGRKASAIIEVKAPDEGPTEDLDKTQQGMKYRVYGVPVVLFWSMEYYSDLKKFLQDNTVTQQPLIKETEKQEHLKRLRTSLSIASMSAYDLQMGELEEYLERKTEWVSNLLQESLKT